MGVTPGEHMRHGRRGSCVGHILDPIVLLPACVAGLLATFSLWCSEGKMGQNRPNRCDEVINIVMFH